MKNSNLYDRSQAAAYLGIKPQTLASWACNHRNAIPFIKIGRSVKYCLADLDAFIQQNRVGGAV
ncbi:MAG: helix-turn-helix domain-containing protein [Gallionellaceae bacterium]|nr:helix-turn-helix domain-containing protein [Gallionellaceae bacterium]